MARPKGDLVASKTLVEVNPIFWQSLEQRGLDAEQFTRSIMEKGRLTDSPGVPEDLRRLFVTALEFSPEHHLTIQAAFQRHVDNSVSKTINLPHEIALRPGRMLDSA